MLGFVVGDDDDMIVDYQLIWITIFVKEKAIAPAFFSPISSLHDLYHEV